MTFLIGDIHYVLFEFKEINHFKNLLNLNFFIKYLCFDCLLFCISYNLKKYRNRIILVN